MTLNDDPHTIVGVLPESFDFASVYAPGSRFDLFFPFPLSPETNRYGNTMAMIGRLKPGVSPAQAQSEIRTLGVQASREHPERNSFEGYVTPLTDHVNGRMRPALGLRRGRCRDAHRVAPTCPKSQAGADRVQTRKEAAIRTALAPAGGG